MNTLAKKKGISLLELLTVLSLTSVSLLPLGRFLLNHSRAFQNVTAIGNANRIGQSLDTLFATNKVCSQESSGTPTYNFVKVLDAANCASIGGSWQVVSNTCTQFNNSLETAPLFDALAGPPADAATLSAISEGPQTPIVFTGQSLGGIHIGKIALRAPKFLSQTLVGINTYRTYSVRLEISLTTTDHTPSFGGFPMVISRYLLVETSQHGTGPEIVNGCGSPNG